MATRRAKRTISDIRRDALKSGYRSGLEVTLAKQIEDFGHPVKYETDRIDFVWPSRSAVYTPDFVLPSANGGFFYVEGKGIWDVADRHKHLLIKEQTDFEVRFVFSNANAKIYKNSPTSYGDWCAEHGFQFAHRVIPVEWLEEGVNDNEPKHEDRRPPNKKEVDQLGGSK